MIVFLPLWYCKDFDAMGPLAGSAPRFWTLNTWRPHTTGHVTGRIVRVWQFFLHSFEPLGVNHECEGFGIFCSFRTSVGSKGEWQEVGGCLPMCHCPRGGAWAVGMTHALGQCYSTPFFSFEKYFMLLLGTHDFLQYYLTPWLPAACADILYFLCIIADCE